MAFGVLAIQSAIAGRPRTAVWWALYCVLADKLDGAVARRLDAQSAFGMQLDSLADFLSFGVTPATILYAFLTAHPELGWAEGGWLWALRGILIGYVVCAAVRLARFNVITDGQVAGAERIFFGVPSTFSGGWLMALFATVLKYGDPAWRNHEVSPFDYHLLGGVRLDGVMRVFPYIVAACGLAMVSQLRMPKLGKTRWKLLNLYLVAAVVVGYVVGLLHVYPEFLAGGALTYLLGSVWYHFTAADTRGVRLPPLFG